MRIHLLSSLVHCLQNTFDAGYSGIWRARLFYELWTSLRSEFKFIRVDSNPLESNMFFQFASLSRLHSSCLFCMALAVLLFFSLGVFLNLQVLYAFTINWNAYRFSVHVLIWLCSSVSESQSSFLTSRSYLSFSDFSKQLLFLLRPHPLENLFIWICP